MRFRQPTPGNKLFIATCSTLTPTPWHVCQQQPILYVNLFFSNTVVSLQASLPTPPTALFLCIPATHEFEGETFTKKRSLLLRQWLCVKQTFPAAATEVPSKRMAVLQNPSLAHRSFELMGFQNICMDQQDTFRHKTGLVYVTSS